MNRKQIDKYEIAFPDDSTEVAQALNQVNDLLCDIACLLKEIAGQLADLNENGIQNFPV